MKPVGRKGTSRKEPKKKAAAAAKGVDSRHGSDEAEAAAVSLARRLDCAVCVSGAEDIVTDGTRLARVANGHPLMPLVTGLGCTATALAFLGLAGERAGARAAGPGSFQVHLLDALYAITPEELAASCRIREERHA